jgi:Mn2+/Fe2+ NRAMP family transporter
LKSPLSLFRSLIGPTAVMAAGTMGAGAIASFLLAGAWFRYDLLWVIALMLPVFVISADSASRIGALNPDRGLFTLVRERMSPLLAWLILGVVVPVHFLVSMGQLSVMLSALEALVAAVAPGVPMNESTPVWVQVGTSLGLAIITLWLLFSRGYDRLERAMTVLMVLMLVCFLIVGLRGLVEWRAILAGFVPSLPPDLPLPGGQDVRVASSSIIAMVGAAIAPAALLGLPYLSADAGGDPGQLNRAFRKAVLNLGVVFGAYAILVVVAGGFALYPLVHHASLSDVGEASAVLRGALPGALAALGPVVFNIGLFTAALTTLVVAAQVTVYFMLDVVGRDWRFTTDNRPFHVLLSVFILGAAALAPLWDFPALLKVILLMGVNVLVIPVVYGIVIALCNSQAVMGKTRMEAWRNGILVLGLLSSLVLAVYKAPGYFQLLFG